MPEKKKTNNFKEEKTEVWNPRDLFSGVSK